MPHRSVPLLFAVVLTACAAPPPEGLPTTEAIVGGHVDTGDPAVVYIQGLGGFFSCSGTLISDHVVLTAKHCVQGSGSATPYGPSTFRVGVGTSFGFGGGGRHADLPRVARLHDAGRLHGGPHVRPAGRDHRHRHRAAHAHDASRRRDAHPGATRSASGHRRHAVHGDRLRRDPGRRRGHEVRRDQPRRQRRQPATSTRA